MKKLESGAYQDNPGEDEFFIGWAKAPGIDRRFLIGALPLSLGLTTAAAWGVSSSLPDPGAGAWLTNATHEIEGLLSLNPYPMIFVPDASRPGGVDTVLVIAEGKCTSSLKLAEQEDMWVRASGVLIERGSRQALEVPLTHYDWLQVIDPPASALVEPDQEWLGTMDLRGTIMDTKCFFGVMKPARSKTHKACASLCIRGGIPPSFWARTKDGRESVLLMTDANGGPLKEEILPLVAEPVSAKGEVVRVGDILHFRADPSAYKLL
ncbi:MAG: hypothetical protein AAFY84_13900 [Pseudomonadota bacterium]